MKKFTYFISCIALLVGVVLFVQSCMKTDENKQDTVETEADKFVASPEYQAFLEKERMERFNINLLLTQLPDDQYKEFITLNKKAMMTQGRDEKNVFLKNMSDILGYDILGHISTCAKERHELFLNRNFSPEEMIRAEIKYSYKCIVDTKTRVARKKEKDPNREARLACMDECEQKRQNEAALCRGGSIEAEQECLTAAEIKCYECNDDCKRMYPRK